MANKLTPAQAQAIQPDATVWVHASAGTGKTQVLTARVLRLFLEGTKPDALLCLTFTKAAAAEMAQRLFKTLSGWVTADQPTLDAELERLGVLAADDTRTAARALFAQALEARGGLKIMTIHAFCQSMLARFPLEAGLTPGFSLLDDRTDASLRRQLLAELIETAVAEQDHGLLADIAELAQRQDEDTLTKLLSTVMRALPGFGDIDRVMPESIAPQIRSALGLPLDGDATTWLAGELAAGRPDLAELRLLADGWSQGSTTVQKDAEKLYDLLSRPADYAANFERLARVFMTSKHKVKADMKLRNKNAETALPGTDARALGLAVQIVAMDERRRLFEAARLAATAARVALAYARKLRAAKAGRGLVGFDDLIDVAAALLTDASAAPWVLYKLDSRIDQILMDEAQDSNAAQWEIVNALSADFYAGAGARPVKRTVFAVGDLKQAIYRFQGAAPDIFARSSSRYQAQAAAADLPFADIALDTSFRSGPAVLAAVDAVLTQRGKAVFGLDQDTPPHVAARAYAAGEVRWWPLVEADDSSDDASDMIDVEADLEARWLPKAETKLARQLAEQIADWVGKVELPARKRAISAGDILVLVRTRTELVPLLASMLTALGIAVAGVDRIKVSNQLAGQDVLAALRFVLQPDDDYTLGCLLKSPLLGWDEDALFALAQPRGKASLWQALKAAADAGDPRAAAAEQWLLALLAETDLRPPYELLEWLLSAHGARARLIRHLGSDADEAVTVLLDLALAYEQGNVPSLQGFVQWIDQSDIEIKRDPDVPRDEVRIMTAHGAKGLQAPIVILADANGKPVKRTSVVTVSPGSQGGDLPMWYGGSANKVGPIADARARSDQLEEEEYWRLLYVAMTRAEDMLCVVGFKPGKTISDTWHQHIGEALKTIAHTEEPDARWGTARVHRFGAPMRVAQTLVPDPAAVPDLPGWAVQPPPPEETPPRPLSPSRIPGEAEVPTAPPSAAQRAARARGVLLHRLLERLPAVPVTEREAAALRLAKDQPEVAAAALAVLNDPAFAPVFSPDALAEVALSAVLEGAVISGRADRLIPLGDRVLLVDYKTGTWVPRHADEVPGAVLRQMAAYRAALLRIFPGKTIDIALLYTAAPKLMPLPAALLNPLLPW